MSDIRSHRDLLVWQQAMDLTISVYRLTKDWPREELYGLTSRARRAAVSVASNIAEGYGRESRSSYVHFLKISQGSLREIETHIELGMRLGYLSQQQADEAGLQLVSVSKLLHLLIRKLENSQSD